MSRHFLDLDGAATITTRYFRLTQRAVADVSDARGMGVVHGVAGLGKTFSVSCATRSGALPACSTNFPKRPSMRLVARQILAAITGVIEQGTLAELSDSLLATLAAAPRIVVVDEAQNLNEECVEYLRFLHDDPRTDFALLLVGGNRCWNVLSRHAMLRSRVYRRVCFEPLSQRDVLAIMPRYHRIYRKVDEELLLLVDDAFGQGNFRNWASFTKTAAQVCSELSEPFLIEEVARNAFALLGGGEAAA